MAHYSRYVRTELLRQKCFSLGEPNCNTTVQESGPSSREIAANDNKAASVMIISRRVSGTSAHAAAWLRLCPSQRRPRHTGAAGLARAQKHPAHGALHRVGS